MPKAKTMPSSLPSVTKNTTTTNDSPEVGGDGNSSRAPTHSPTQTRKSTSGNRAVWSDFLKANYSLVRDENPEWSPKEIRGHIGKLWKAAPQNPNSLTNSNK